MSYTIDRVIKDVDFEDVDRRARQALTDHGFGVLTEIDVKATMKKSWTRICRPIGFSGPAILAWPGKPSVWSLAWVPCCLATLFFVRFRRALR
jgi:hypothetical protein